MLTGFNNYFNYYDILKKSFKTYDCAKPIKETNDNNVLF